MIAQNDKVVNLKRLDLSCNPIGYNGLCILLDARSSNLAQLEHLDLYSCGIKAPLVKKTMNTLWDFKDTLFEIKVTKKKLVELKSL